MSTLNGIHDDVVDSPAKQKAANYTNRSAILLRRTPHLLAAAKFKLLLFLSVLCVSFFLASRLSSFAGWIPDDNPPPSYTVLINTWKRSSPLKKSAAHYASCAGVDSIRVAWGEVESPSEKLKSDLDRIVKSKAWRKEEIGVEVVENYGGRFKPIGGVRTDAILSVDDDVIVPCSDLEFAFLVWRTAPRTMVGFVPRMNWLDLNALKSGSVYHRYGGWLSIWWKGSYSMVLSKASFFHNKYLDVYTNSMPLPMQDYLARERQFSRFFLTLCFFFLLSISSRNCEDIAMSIVVANASGTPPLWVKGKIQEIGSSWGRGNDRGGNEKREECLNDLISFYDKVPLLSTNVKAVNARREWLW
ncbi:Glycosylinositol phosphorylceramide mannosyl transferase 1 [Linum perenne]